MIKRVEKIEITEKDYPFSRAADKCGFQNNGYREEEYFLYGTSNIYCHSRSGIDVKYEGAEYVNRMIVRRPEKTFSGRVIVEILNSTSFIDFDRNWVLLKEKILRDGSIYVGITSKPNVIPALLRFNRNRYQRLDWTNPLPEGSVEKLGNLEGASRPETEDGLFWDMLTDLALMIRNQELDFFQEYKPVDHYQYLTGWSQSGGYLIRYINDFIYRNSHTVPLFDGYLSCGGTSSLMPDLNQSYGATAMSESRIIRTVREPYIEVHTESENQGWGNHESRGENSDSIERKYRVYDIPGASHDTDGTMGGYYWGDTDVYSSGIVPVYPGQEPYPNDYPYEILFQTALEYLENWSENDVSPPVIEPIEVDDDCKNKKDPAGNTLGGWRLPCLNYPVCTYFLESTPLKPDYGFAATLFGYIEPFSADFLRKTYESLEKYKNIIVQETDECIKKGFMLPWHREKCISYAVDKAQHFGLK